jgi:MFS family permease
VSAAAPAAPALGAGALFWRVYLPFAAAYFLSYLYRSVNAVVGPVIAEDLGLSAGDLGLLSAAYFIMFAAIQLPLGIALDRFGPRLVQTALMCVAALGGLLFGLGGSLAELVFGRAMIGLGVAAGLMAALKVNTLWYRQERLPLMNGLLMAAGGLGSLTATAPAQAALGVMSWHSLFFVLAGISLAVAAFLFLAVPERRLAQQADTLAEQVRMVGTIVRDPFFWRVVPFFSALQMGFIGIQTLWIGPWLRDVAGQDASTRGANMLLVAMAMTLGFLTSGMVSAALGRLGLSTLRVATLAGAAFTLVCAWLAAACVGATPSAVPPMLAWIVFGLLGPYSIVFFPVLTGAFALHVAGRVTTSANFIMFAGVFLAQWGIGRILDFWPRTEAGGYAPEGYAVGFGLVVAVMLASLLWLLVSPARPANRPAQ